jgi:DNA-binding transcriptional ArsR family regulator
MAGRASQRRTPRQKRPQTVGIRAIGLVNVHPGEVRLQVVLEAVADPVRRSILRQLARRTDWTHAGDALDLTLDPDLSEAAIGQHCNVLRTAGLVEQRDVGSRRLNRLRRPEFDEHFPGLLDLVLREMEL